MRTRRSNQPHPKEVDVAAAAAAWLEQNKWDVYQEVRPCYGGPTADIVAVQGRLVWIVEAKTSLSFSVMAQIDGWYSYAHFRSVAVPFVSRHDRGRDYAEHHLEGLGVGLFRIDTGYRSQADFNVRDHREPRLNRHARLAGTILEMLEPEHKTFSKAGSANGSCWSPFRRTLKYVREYLAANPGATLKEVIESIDHHYASGASARACLWQWIDYGHMPEVSMRRHDDGKLRLYLKQEETTHVEG